MKNNTDIPNELYYLDDNFSVRSLRKYQLKEILAAHNIPYLQSITRVDLINLFKKHIEPRREEILRQYKQKELEQKQHEAPEAYGRGHRATHRPIKFEDEVDTMPAPKRRQKTTITATTSSSSQTTESAHQKDKDGFMIPTLPKRDFAPSFNAEDSFAEEDDEDATYKPTNRNTLPKKPSSSSSASSKQPAVVSAPKRSNKQPRANFSPPSFNAEDSFAEEDEDEHSVLEKQRTVRQKSPIIKKEHVKTTNEQAKTTVANDEEEEDTDYHADGDDSDDEDEDIGEVDKEELVLLYKDQSVPPETFVSAEYPATRSQRLAAANLWKARLRRIGYIFCSIYLVVGLIGLGITAYARNKNGYCQNYAVTTPPNSNSVSSVFFSQLPSPCIPCPDHGVCIDGELTCDTLYERKTPLYNIGHAFPIGDDCIHNSVLGKYVSKVERKIKNKLALLQGEAACQHLLAHPESDEPVPISRIAVKTVLADLKAAVEPFVPADKVDEIMVIALTSVLEDPKVHYWEIENERYLGTDNVKYTFMCQMKRLYSNTPLNIKLYILSFISALSAFIGASRDYRKNMLYKQKIDDLVKATTDELKKQYENHIKDPNTYTSPAVSVSQLRSSIVDVNNSKTINDWHKVVEKIENHPLIRKSFHEVRGDPVEYWELTA